MKKLYHILDERPSAAMCRGIIDRAMTLPPMEGTIGDDSVVKKIRSSELRWIDTHHPQFRDIAEFVFKAFQDANKHFGLDLGFYFPLQFTTYHATEGGHYDWHRDVFWPSVTPWDRKLSFIMQLSDITEYEGGDLEFQDAPDWDPTAFKTPGSVLVFPSLMQHRVSPVTKGTRKSLVSWIEGPTWR